MRKAAVPLGSFKESPSVEGHLSCLAREVTALPSTDISPFQTRLGSEMQEYVKGRRHGAER
jgi:hypothetical protein